MLNAHEQAFVQTFVQRERRARTLIELATPAKRAVFLNRLAHTYAMVLDMRWLVPISPLNSSVAEVLPVLHQAGATKMCFAIAALDEIDGKELPLADALQMCIGRVWPTILLCTNGTVGYFEAEAEPYPPPRFLLRHA